MSIDGEATRGFPSRATLVVVAVVIVVLGAAYVIGSGDSKASFTASPSTTSTTSSTTSTMSTSPVAPTSTVPSGPVDLGTFNASPPSPADCGSVLPVELTVDHARVSQDPAPSTPPVGRQVVRRWVTPERTVELRWPPDPRQLLVGPSTDTSGGQIGSWEMYSHTLLTVRGNTDNSAQGPVLFVLTERADMDLAALAPDCSVVQLRIIAADRTQQTVGVRLPLPIMSGQLVDLGPLVGIRRSSSRVVPIDRSTECPTRVSEVARVRAAAPNRSPMGALRDFLESDAGTGVQQPELSSPFTEIHLTSDGSYRYEHFIAWSEYVAITVEATGHGWAVTHWEHGTC